MFSKKTNNKTKTSLACPLPFCLLVSLTFENTTGCFIQCAPKFGESGWMYTQLGVGGSGLPPETHSPLTYFHRCPSTDTKSSRNEYIALGSNPVMLILRTGNIRLAMETRKFNLNLAQSDLPPILGRLAYLPFFVTIISLVSDLNRLHKSASSRVILTLPSSLVSSLFVLSVSLGLSLDIVFSAACKMWFTEKDVGCFFSSVCIVCAVSLFFCSK